MNKRIEQVRKLIFWRPDSKQCYCIFLFFLFIALFCNPLEQLAHPIAYADELIALCAVPLLLSEYIINRRKKLFQKDGYARYIVAFLLIGMVSSIVFHYQPLWKAALPDMFLCVKFWLSIYVGKVFFRNISIKDYSKEIFIIIRVIIWLFAALILVDYLVWVFRSGNGLFEGQVRFGIKSVKLFYSHPTFFAGSCVFLIVVLASICEEVKESSKYIIILGVMSILTLRSKALGTAVLVAAIYILTYLKKKKLNMKMLICCFVGLLLIGGKQIYYYFFSSIQAESARYQLTAKSIQVARDHFPLGAGFGTYGSYISGEVYSPLYEQYELSRIWGLEKGAADFVSDNFWPMILGQTGWLGLFAFGLAVIFLFLQIQRLYEVRTTFYMSGLVALGFLLISSMAESAFVNPMAIPFAVWLGILLKETSYDGEERRIGKYCSSGL